MNGEQWAIYECDKRREGNLLYLNINKNKFKEIDGRLEDFIVSIIQEVELIDFKYLSYLNLKN